MGSYESEVPVGHFQGKVQEMIGLEGLGMEKDLVYRLKMGTLVLMRQQKSLRLRVACEGIPECEGGEMARLPWPGRGPLLLEDT